VSCSAAEAPAEEVPAEVPTKETASSPTVPDDLKRIEGIDPKLSSVLLEASVTTFAALAAKSPDEIQGILDTAGVGVARISDPATWPEQARWLLRGSTTSWLHCRTLSKEAGAPDRSKRLQTSSPVILIGAMLAACSPVAPEALPDPSRTSATDSPTATPGSATPAVVEAAASPGLGVVLAAGEIDLSAAQAFGEPGFHSAFMLVHELEADVTSREAKRLVVTLWDAGRPAQICDREHPLSGCATIDWSDAESRPNVPPGGVFNNSLTLELESGSLTFFLSETGVLRDAPDAYDPG